MLHGTKLRLAAVRKAVSQEDWAWDNVILDECIVMEFGVIAVS